MNKQLLDFYKDSLISSFGQTTATVLSQLSEGEISQDEITRLLNSELASESITRLATYAEISPSGQGSACSCNAPSNP